MPRGASSFQAIGFPCALLSTVTAKLPPPPEPTRPPNSSEFPQLPKETVLRGFEIEKPKNPHVPGKTVGVSRRRNYAVQTKREDPDRIGGP